MRSREARLAGSLAELSSAWIGLAAPVGYLLWILRIGPAAGEHVDAALQLYASSLAVGLATAAPPCSSCTGRRRGRRGSARSAMRPPSSTWDVSKWWAGPLCRGRC